MSYGLVWFPLGDRGLPIEMLKGSSDPKANWRTPADLYHTTLHRLIALNHLDIQLVQARVLQMHLPTGTSGLFPHHQRIHCGYR